MLANSRSQFLLDRLKLFISTESIFCRVRASVRPSYFLYAKNTKQSHCLRILLKQCSVHNYLNEQIQNVSFLLQIVFQLKLVSCHGSTRFFSKIYYDEDKFIRLHIKYKIYNSGYTTEMINNKQCNTVNPLETPWRLIQMTTF